MNICLYRISFVLILVVWISLLLPVIADDSLHQVDTDPNSAIFDEKRENRRVGRGSRSGPGEDGCRCQQRRARQGKSGGRANQGVGRRGKKKRGSADELAQKKTRGMMRGRQLTLMRILDADGQHEEALGAAERAHALSPSQYDARATEGAITARMDATSAERTRAMSRAGAGCSGSLSGCWCCSSGWATRRAG